MKDTVTPRAPARVWADVVAELPDLCTVLDATGAVVLASASARTQLGRDPADLVGRPACDLIPLDDRRNCTTWLRSALVGHDPPELVHGIVRADGEVLPYETRLRLMTRDDRRLVVAVSRDVSARAEFDRHLSEMSRLWNTVCETVREGVLVLTGTGLVVAANRAAAGLLDADASGLGGSAVDDLLTCAEVGGTPVDVATLRARQDTDLVVGVAGGTRVLRARASVLSEDDADEHIIVVLDPVPEPVPNPVVGGGATQPVRRPLSRREIQVLTMLVDGQDVRTISRDLDISVHTTRAYVRSLLKKLDARNQLQAAVVALRAGLIGLS